MDFSGYKYVVVGAGFFGAVVAERIANINKERVLILEERNHLGGNSFSSADPDTNIEVHHYGSHIFHTSDKKVWDYINQFTDFNSYHHRVLTSYKNNIYSMPINLGTINTFYKKGLNPCEAQKFIEEEVRRDFIAHPQNLEEKAISLIGRQLYEAFIKGYTQKQWETELTKLPENIITRLPVRFSYNDRYFSDLYEGLPVEGYGSIFKKMLSNPLIEIRLGVDYFKVKDQIQNNQIVIYTGPIDRFFDYKFGLLGWRTCDFEKSILDVDDYQGTSVMNYADVDVPYTRIHEFKHYHPERKHVLGKTVIFKEFSRKATEADTPYYPINTAKDKEILALYKAEAAKVSNTIFGGRLGNYVYVDMHQAIAMGLNAFQSLLTKA